MAVEVLRCCTCCRAIYRTSFERCPTDGALLEPIAEDPLIGSTLAKHYVIDALIGEGGMGRVYRAHHALLHHRQFAVKVMLGDLAATLPMRMRFGQEAAAASRLAHSNVVSIVDYGKTDEGLLFLAMDLLEGRTLAEVIDDEAPLPARRALEIARQVCLGLEHAHEKGLVHRDFKPENVMITRGAGGERAVIMDFGIAISRDADDEGSARLTSTGIALGTPIYAAPEQTHGRPVDERADLFALGVTLYEMLSGKVPFDGTSIEIIHKNAGTAPPSIESRSGVRVVPAVETVVRRLMERSPDDRFASARDVIDAIDTLVALLQAPLTDPALISSTASVTTDRLPEQRRRWIRPLAVLVIALAIPVAWLALRSDAKPESVLAAAPIAAPPPPPITQAAPVAAPVVPAVSPGIAPPIDKTVAAKRERRTIPKMPRIERAAPAPLPEAVAEVPVPEPAAPPPEPTPIASLPPVLPPPPVPPAAPVLVTRARTAFSSLEVRGSLSTAVVRRALERVDPDLRRCFTTVAMATKRSPATTVHATFVVDDTRQATTVRASATGWPQLAVCVATVLAQLRTQSAPDVGTVPVSVDVAFMPEGAP